MHEYRMQTDKEYAALVAFQNATANQGLEDQSLTMLLAGNGLKPLLNYGLDPVHLSTRVVNAVSAKDAGKLLGIPSKEQVTRAFVDRSPEHIDKLLWKVTGNAVKANALGLGTP